MKIDLALRFGVTMLLVVSAACDRLEDSTDDLRRDGKVNLVATNIEGKVSVRIENGSKESIVLVDEPLIGFGRGGPRAEIILRDEGGRISPCAHLDPPRDARPPDTLAPGQAMTKTVSLDLIRKVYCLKPGRYELLATYPSSTTMPVESPAIAVEIER